MASIPLKYPKECRGLAATAKHNGWGDTADAITEMRNTVTHWTTGKASVDGRAWIDARQLAIQYLELSILWSLGYQGKTFDRIRGPLSPGCGVRVPWSAD